MPEENALPTATAPADDGVIVNTGDVTETPEKGADLAPASEAEHKDQPQESDYSEGAKKAINKKHWEAKEAQRETVAIQAKYDALKASQEPTGTAPVVPDLPDIDLLSNEEYQVQMKARDTALIQQADFNAAQNYQNKQAQIRQDEALRQQQTDATNLRQTYANKATERGFDADEVLRAATDIANYGVSDAVADMLLNVDDGPDMTLYLRQNPETLAALQSMPVHQQIDHMSNVVRINAESLKPKSSNAPPPPTDISAGGQLNEPDPLLEGLTLNI